MEWRSLPLYPRRSRSWMGRSSWWEVNWRHLLDGWSNILLLSQCLSMRMPSNTITLWCTVLLSKHLSIEWHSVHYSWSVLTIKLLTHIILIEVKCYLVTVTFNRLTINNFSELLKVYLLKRFSWANPSKESLPLSLLLSPLFLSHSSECTRAHTWGAFSCAYATASATSSSSSVSLFPSISTFPFTIVVSTSQLPPGPESEERKTWDMMYASSNHLSIFHISISISVNITYSCQRGNAKGYCGHWQGLGRSNECKSHHQHTLPPKK